MNKYLLYNVPAKAICFIFKVEPATLGHYQFKMTNLYSSLRDSKTTLIPLEIYKITEIVVKFTASLNGNATSIAKEEPNEEDKSRYIDEYIMHRSDMPIDIIAEDNAAALKAFYENMPKDNCALKKMFFYAEENSYAKYGGGFSSGYGYTHCSRGISIYNEDLSDIPIEEYIARSFSPKKNYLVLEGRSDIVLKEVGEKLLLSLLIYGDRKMERMLKYLDEIDKIHPFSTVVIDDQSANNFIMPKTELHSYTFIRSIFGEHPHLLFNGEEDFIFNPKVLYYNESIGVIQEFMNPQPRIQAMKVEDNDNFALPTWLAPYEVKGEEKDDSPSREV